MLLVPNDIEGLRSVIDKLDSSVFQYAKSKVQQKELEIILPKFQIEETSRSEEVLKNLGLNKVFSRNEADLSLMSEDMDLHVDEIVQFVNIRVDEGGSSEAAFSASNPQSRNMNENKMETFEINRPFLYFVMDYEKEFVIVSGKVYTPDFKEQNVSIEIELDRS